MSSSLFVYEDKKISIVEWTKMLKKTMFFAVMGKNEKGTKMLSICM
jgi:hypothetical protein